MADRQSGKKTANQASGREVDEAADLDALLRSLGADVVELVSAPRGLGVGVGDPVIHDPSERSALAAGAVVLAVGVRPGSPEAETLLRDADRANASAVIFKRSGEAAELGRTAASAAVAVLSVPEEMTWTQLHGLLVNARRFSAQSDGPDGIAGVPMGDLFALANAVAAIVGGAVTIEDPGRRVLAYSTLGDQPIDPWRRNSILGRQVPDSPGMRKIYQRLLETDGVMTADRATLQAMLKDGPEEVVTLEARSAVAIRAGRQTIGSIWVIHEDALLTDEAKRALAEAARIAAPHMIQARAARDVERRVRGERLVAILEGRGSAEENAGRLGLVPSASFTVLAFSASESDAMDQFDRERLVDLVGVYCEALHGPSSVVAIGDNVYALLQSEKGSERARVVRVAREVQGQTEGRTGGAVLAAVSSTVERLQEVAVARREAEHVLAVLRSHAGGRMLAAVDEVRSEVILLELAELSREHPSLTQGKLTALLDHDAARGTEYALTLRAYLDSMGDVASASTRISVHPNTFRYRIRRLLQLFDIDIENADERVVIELQLRLLADNGR
jgi:DNA-binding PucR family transcriptional regulator